MSPRQGLDRGALLSAAAQLADSDGFQALTLAALAQRLDVRSPSLYNHISGLPGLRQEMALMSVQQLSRALTAAIADRTGDDAIQAIAAAYIGFVREHPGSTKPHSMLRTARSHSSPRPAQPRWSCCCTACSPTR